MDTNQTTAIKGWKLILLLVLSIPTAMAWLGNFDSLSEQYVDQSLLNAGAIYATARGINALVSVLQGTELDLPLLTFTIGELLDPVNDLIERFSGIMLIALGSLAMQKILLGIVSHSVFNLLITLLALGTAMAFLARNERVYHILLRAFIVAAFFRFSLGLVVLANTQVDIYFLGQDDLRRHAAMQNFEGELRKVSTMAGVNGPSEQLIKDTKDRISGLERAQVSEQRNLQQQKIDLKGFEQQLDILLEDRPLSKKLNPFSEDSFAIADAKKQVIRVETDIDLTISTLDSISQNLRKEREKLLCMQKRQSGEACSFLEHITTQFSSANLGPRIIALQDRVQEFAETTIALLMSALLKSVVIPLVFIYVLIRLAGLSWSRVR